MSWPARPGLAHCSALLGLSFGVRTALWAGAVPAGPVSRSHRLRLLGWIVGEDSGLGPGVGRGWWISGSRELEMSGRDAVCRAAASGEKQRAENKWPCMALRRCHADCPPASLGPRSVPGPFPRWPALTQWPTFPTVWPEPKGGRNFNPSSVHPAKHRALVIGPAVPVRGWRWRWALA